MSRKFIKIATAAIILFAFTAVPLQADDSLAAAAGIELSTLETISGNVFRDV